MKSPTYIISNLRVFMEHYCSRVGAGISRFVLFNFVRSIVKGEEYRFETHRYKSESNGAPSRRVSPGTQYKLPVIAPSCGAHSLLGSQSGQPSLLLLVQKCGNKRQQSFNCL